MFTKNKSTKKNIEETLKNIEKTWANCIIKKRLKNIVKPLEKHRQKHWSEKATLDLHGHFTSVFESLRSTRVISSHNSPAELVRLMRIARFLLD